MTTSQQRTRRAFDLDEAMTILARTPRTLDAMLRGLPDAWAVAHEGGDTWSPFEVMGHLVHGERTDWLTRVRIILAEGESRPFTPFDRLAQFAAFEVRTLESLLDEFSRLRGDSLQALSAMELTSNDFDRTGRHPAFGRVTLRQLLATWVAHDLDHVVQIARTLARQYSDEVGPWRAYLGVIHRQP
jgi:hypothetical protein